MTQEFMNISNARIDIYSLSIHGFISFLIIITVDALSTANVHLSMNNLKMLLYIEILFSRNTSLSLYITLSP